MDKERTAQDGRAESVHHGKRRWDQLDDVAGIYLIQIGPYVKIGWSSRMGRRLREIEAKLPDVLTFHGMIEGGTKEEEAALHWKFRRYRSKHEWFKVRGEVEDLLHMLKNLKDGQQLGDVYAV